MEDPVTVKIGKQDLERKHTMKFSPCMFQEYIERESEFRVTIVGECVHATQIFSQRSTKTMHDWRNYDSFKKTP